LAIFNNSNANGSLDRFVFATNYQEYES